MAQHPPIVFADAVTSVSLANGVVRITFGSLDAESKLQTTGTLVMPLSQFGSTVRNLVNATNELVAKAREAQAKAGETPAPEAGEAEAEAGKMTFPH